MGDSDNIALPAPEQTPKQLLDSAASTVAYGLEHIRACLERVVEQIESSDRYDTKLGSHLAYLTEHATKITDGLRLLESHDRKSVKEMTQDERDEMVGHYILDADVETRRKLRALLDAADKPDGVL